MSENIINIGNFVLDENSIALNVIKSSTFLTGSMYDTEGKYDHETYAKKLGMSLDDYVRRYRRDYGKTAEMTYDIENSIYGECNLRFWAKYQMTYVIKQSTIADHYRNGIGFIPRIKEIELPFPAIMVVLNLDRTERKNHSIAYIICKRDNDKIDVSAIVDGEVYYCPICFDSVMGIFSNNCIEYCSNSFERFYLSWAWYIVLFLAAYNRNRKIETVRRVKLKGKNGVKAESSDYYFGDLEREKVIYTSVEKEDISVPGAALSIDGLIPPDEREEEIIIQKGVHESPKRHWVTGHYRTYWTGEGRKKPVRKFIESFERGRVDSKMVSKVKIYE